ncbi:DoxX family protein [Streptomyces sp. NBC_00554]|uniref:DoxX family protein n=1 Tax=Streptomyces sp. NBC_00554 TaxID=2903661 RepID=UPI00352F09F5|nr:DoxX family protein [Streptomyces sp. NBC_00554]
MTTADTAVLVLRAVAGLTMVAHGYHHVLGGGGLAGTSRWFASMGLRPPRVHALLSGAGELACGLGLLAGLLTPLCAAFVVGTMTVAGVAVHRPNGFFVFKDGYEYVLLLAVVSVVIGLLGPGRVSVDHALGIDDALDGGVGAALAGGVGILGAALLLALCWRPGTTRSETETETETEETEMETT